MNKFLPIVVVGLLSAYGTAAQNSASAQAGGSTQSAASVQANKSGASASGSGAATASGSASSKQNSVAASGSGNQTIATGSKVDATLTKPLDAKKNKPGDQVEARTNEDVKQDGKVIMKKGTHLVGHVTQSQARANGQAQSQLGVVFDHAVMKNGEEVPFNASIQALAAAQSSLSDAPQSDDMMASTSAMGAASGTARSGGGLMNGVASTAGGATGNIVNTASSMPVNAAGTTTGSLSTVTRSAGAVGGLSSNGRLASNSSGVFGLQGLAVSSAASGAMQESTIVSSTRNVHLESGTQMLLNVTGQAK